MAYAKYICAPVIGVLGFVSGTYQERLRKNKAFEVSAANVLLPTPDISDIPPAEPNIIATHPAEVMKFGLPGVDTLRVKRDFVLSYDRRNRIANWVFEHLTAESIKYREDVDRGKCEFFEDETIHPYFRSRSVDFKRSGYDRGHLACAGNHRNSQECIKDTFVLSNITPQVGKGFNRDYWNKLEKYVRRLTKIYKDIYVCTGPLYLPRLENDGKKYVKYEVIGANNVAVPTHFFKVLVCETQNHEFDLQAFVLPNAPIDDNIPLNAFMVPKDSVERAAGLLLFDQIPPNAFRSINQLKF